MEEGAREEGAVLEGAFTEGLLEAGCVAVGLLVEGLMPLGLITFVLFAAAGFVCVFLLLVEDVVVEGETGGEPVEGLLADALIPLGFKTDALLALAFEVVELAGAELVVVDEFAGTWLTLLGLITAGEVVDGFEFAAADSAVCGFVVEGAPYR